MSSLLPSSKVFLDRPLQDNSPYPYVCFSFSHSRGTETANSGYKNSDLEVEVFHKSRSTAAALLDSLEAAFKAQKGTLTGDGTTLDCIRYVGGIDSRKADEVWHFLHSYSLRSFNNG